MKLPTVYGFSIVALLSPGHLVAVILPINGGTPAVMESQNGGADWLPVNGSP